MVNPRCFFDLVQNDEKLGRIVVELFADTCPKTSENFRALCTGEMGVGSLTQKQLWFKGSIVHRVIQGFMCQMGDFSKGNGTGGESIYGGIFDDENFDLPHDSRGILSMANRGAHTNGSQFFILFGPQTHLDNKHVVFGKIVSGNDVIDRIEKALTDIKDRPIDRITVAKCGELQMKRRHVEVKTDNAEEGAESGESKKKKRKKKEKKKKKKKKDSSSDDDDDSNAEKVKKEIEEAKKEPEKPKSPSPEKIWKGIDGRIRKGRGHFRHETKIAKEEKQKLRAERSPRDRERDQDRGRDRRRDYRERRRSRERGPRSPRRRDNRRERRYDRRGDRGYQDRGRDARNRREERRQRYRSRSREMVSPKEKKRPRSQSKSSSPSPVKTKHEASKSKSSSSRSVSASA